MRLLLGVGNEPVGGLDDLRLADLTTGRLRRVAVGEVGVLHTGHGVHGVDERHLPAVVGEPPDLAGEPVVRVDEVVVALGGVGGRAHDAGGKGAQLARQVLLAEPLVRPRRDVAHEHPGRQLDHRVEVGRRRAGEDLHLDAAPGELAGHLDDIDVQATGISRAGLLERRGVHAEHRDPARTLAGGHGAESATPRWLSAAGDQGGRRPSRRPSSTTRARRCGPRSARRRHGRRAPGRWPCRCPARW